MKELYHLANPQIIPPLQQDFAPAVLCNQEFRKLAQTTKNAVPLIIALERGNSSVSVYKTICFDEKSEYAYLNLEYAERIIKFLLWQKGGWKISISGPKSVYDFISKVYSPNGFRAFDADFMGGVYGKSFTVAYVAEADIPQQMESSTPLGGHLDGCRIGFDLGASDRKVSAVIDGEAVYTEEVNWNPKDATDPAYHYSEINAALKAAASHMPKVDAIGGSSAGVYIDNRPRVASLFRGIPKELFEEKIGDLFLNLQKDWGGIPFDVVNDGEVTALAGAMSLQDNSVLGIALGSSEAGGYVNPSGEITTWLNELAFCPVDYHPNAPVDEWSGDKGCGALYFSQQAVFRLAKVSGIEIDESLDLAEKLKSVQKLLEANDQRAINIWESIGVFAGYGIANYADFYEIKHVLILGRVTSGKGGNIILEKAKQVLELEFKELTNKIIIHLPDEKLRRIGQAVAAASLPVIA